MIRSGAIITGILSCEKRASRRSPIRESFFHSLPNPFFFSGREGCSSALEGDVLFVDAPDTYEGIPKKVWHLYEQLLALEFDYFFRLDDDSVPHLGTFYALVTSIYGAVSGEDRPDYIGSHYVPPDENAGGERRNWHIGKVSDPALNAPYTGTFSNAYLGGGHGVLLSRKAIEVIVEHGHEQFFDPKELYEDKVHGDVLAAHGIYPIACGDNLVVTDVPEHRMSLQNHVLNGLPAAAPQFSPGWKGAIFSREEIRKLDSAPPQLFACHSKKVLFLAISECGSSTIKNVVYTAEHGSAPTGGDPGIFTHGYNPPHVFSVGSTEAKELARQGYSRIAVCRDPIVRSVSCYVNRVLGDEEQHHPFGLIHGCCFDDFLDLCSRIVTELPSVEMDEHIRPQSYYFKPADVDEIIMLDDLDAYLVEVLGLPAPERKNTSADDSFIPTSDQADRIRRIYCEDFKIEPTWIPEKRA